MAKFIKGLNLSEQFFKEIIKPIIKNEFPNLKYSASLIGRGSEVLGFDDQQSVDHDWGPRVMIFINEKDKNKKIKQCIEKELPYTFKGFPVSFTLANHKWGVRLPEKKNTGKINSRIDVYTLDEFFKKYLYFNINKKLSIKDWLIFPQQKLLTLNKGKIFYDKLGLKKVLKQFKYYPKEVWHYILASQWNRIGELSALHFRTYETGDKLGSQVIASKLVQLLMEIWFIYNKEYIPFDKWFGRKFSELPKSSIFIENFSIILTYTDINKRKKHLDKVYSMIAKFHNSLNFPKIPTKTTQFFDRPYEIIQGKKISSKLYEILTPEIKKMKIKNGSIDQLTNQVDLLDNTNSFKKLY